MVKTPYEEDNKEISTKLQKNDLVVIEPQPGESIIYEYGQIGEIIKVEGDVIVFEDNIGCDRRILRITKKGEEIFK